MTGKNTRCITIFKRTSGSTWARVDVAIYKVGKMGKNDIQNMLNDKTQQKTLKNMQKGYVEKVPKGMINGFEWGKFTYDNERNIFFMKCKGDTPTGTVVTLSAEMLCSYGYIGLTFISYESSFKSFTDDYNQILDSFKFDEGYRY